MHGKTSLLKGVSSSLQRESKAINPDGMCARERLCCDPRCVNRVKWRVCPLLTMSDNLIRTKNKFSARISSGLFGPRAFINCTTRLIFESRSINEGKDVWRSNVVRWPTQTSRRRGTAVNWVTIVTILYRWHNTTVGPYIVLASSHFFAVTFSKNVNFQVTLRPE